MKTKYLSQINNIISHPSFGIKSCHCPNLKPQLSPQTSPKLLPTASLLEISKTN